MRKPHFRLTKPIERGKLRADFINWLEMIKQMEQKQQWDLRSVLDLAASVALLAVLSRRFGCPIRLLTGVSCAGCGMTRAWLSVLRLDFRQAFYYHPLFLLPPVGAALWLCRKKLPRKVLDGCMYAMAGAFLIVYVYRMFRGDGGVVSFDPRSGLIYRAYSYFRGGV